VDTDPVYGFRDVGRNPVHALGLYQLPDPGLGVSGVVLTDFIPDAEVVFIIL
jgi:hypothetical protein